MTDLSALALALLIYPFACLMIAITGPHSDAERIDNMKGRADD